MAIGKTNAGGAGGASLNFKVVPGLTQPGTASENTIWVKTESLTGWYFAATQPENMQEGEIWFPTGMESAVEFNALKKNGIQVYPLSAKQMVSGVLVDVTAMSYKGVEWVEWIPAGVLYDSGKTYTQFTKFNPVPSAVTYEDCVEFTSEAIVLSNTSTGQQATAIAFSADVTDYDTIYATVTHTASSPNDHGGFWGNNSENPLWNAAAVKYAFTKNIDSKTTISIDISALSGIYYFAFGHWAGTYDVKIYKIWME